MPRLFFVILVLCGRCWSLVPRAKSEWPDLGYNLCQFVVYKPTSESCDSCFRNADTDWVQASECVSSWLPEKFANCIAFANGNERKFIPCLTKAVNEQNKETNRAQMLYAKGGEYMLKVSDSKIIDNGGAAMFSSMAQDLLFNTKTLENDLAQTSSQCFGRFQNDPVNERWHIHKEDMRSLEKDQSRVEKPLRSSKSKVKSNRAHHRSKRQIVYQYGLVGNDMPFHGVGPLALDVLKGDCVFNSMGSYGNLDELVAAMLDNGYPVAAWIFQEILNNIGSINLP